LPTTPLKWRVAGGVTIDKLTVHMVYPVKWFMPLFEQNRIESYIFSTSRRNTIWNKDITKKISFDYNANYMEKMKKGAS
jgi:hypothetical protein